ncbi:MAG: cell division rane protein [Clostridiales bacterium]|jgi:cell division protein FtsW|nr:cell division rane protein [Clostridiales bacterium]
MATVTRFSQVREQKANEKPQPIKEKLFVGGRTDYTFLVAVLFLLGFGLIMIYSASTYTGITKFGSATYYFYKQLGIAIMSIFIMYIVSIINYKIIAKFVGVIYIFAIGLLILVLIFGKELNGAKRWLFIGPFSLQPSELGKAAVLILAAFVCAKTSKKMKSNLAVFFLFALVVGPPFVLVAAQNLSTALVVGAIPFVIFLVANRKIGWAVTIGVVAIAAVAAIIMFGEGFRMARFQVWKDPFIDPQGKGYQTIQSLYAIGSGGLFGKGLGQSIQKLGFIPEAHNDIIFSIICEELGVFGAVMVMLVFLILIWRCMYIANGAPDLFGTLLAVGLMAQIGVQVLINIAVVTNTIPSTGMPLPFISYGGSSLFFLMAEVGAVMNVARQRKYAFS